MLEAEEVQTAAERETGPSMRGSTPSEDLVAYAVICKNFYLDGSPMPVLPIPGKAYWLARRRRMILQASVLKCCSSLAPAP